MLVTLQERISTREYKMFAVIRDDHHPKYILMVVFFYSGPNCGNAVTIFFLGLDSHYVSRWIGSNVIHEAWTFFLYLRNFFMHD